MSEPQDEGLTLLQRARDGDHVAVREFVKSHQTALLSLIRGRLSRQLCSLVDAEDILQWAWQDFFSLCLSRESFVSSDEIEKFLTVLVSHKIADTHREQLGTGKRDHKRTDTLTTDVADRQPSIELQTTNLEEQQHWLRGLSPKKRAAFLVLFTGGTNMEAAKAACVSIRTIERWVNCACNSNDDRDDTGRS